MSTSASPSPLSAAVLAIGDEVLRGEIANGNAAVLADRLFELGAEVAEHRVVSDEPAAIRSALERLSARHAVVVVTGGLGPTEDDRTVDVVSEMLQVRREIHEPSQQTMRRRFEARGYHLTPNNIRQVEIPAGAQALGNVVGLAPGFRVRLGEAEVFFLPGVPQEMRRIFSDHVAPQVRALVVGRGLQVPAARSWHVFGMGESHIDDRLAGWLDGLEGVSLHFRTALTEVHVRVVVRNRPPDEASALLDRLDQEIHARLGPTIYGTDDETMMRAVQRTFRATRKTLGLAESCTGGYAGQMVTSEPGASTFFQGSVVSYANAVKINVLGVDPAVIKRDGAVSETVAAQMAVGAARVLGADVAVSITGVAGDAGDAGDGGDGGDDGDDGNDKDRSQPVDNVLAAGGQTASDSKSEEKPVGTVCFAVAHEGQVHSETKRFSGQRDRIRRVSAVYALDLARRAVLGIVPGQASSKK